MSEPTLQTVPNCMDDSDPQSLSYDIALKKILAAVQPVIGTETLMLKAALGRTLDADLHAPIDVPPSANSAMDGYAVRSADIPSSGTRPLQLAGAALAGRPYNGAVEPGHCVRIMTGAVIPDGADTVIMQENVIATGTTVTIDARAVSGENIRAMGEDCRKGDLLLPAGSLLTPAALGLIAAVGIGRVIVKRWPKVAVFMTGDELRSIDEPLQAGQIHDSNRYTVYGMLSRLGVDIIDMGIVRDDLRAIETAMLSAAESADAIITSGGVSVGDADLVRQVIEKLGTISFWKVAMKPGRPLAFGSINHCRLFGLPGNPVSTMVTFYRFVQPALKRMMGQSYIEPVTVKVTCSSNLKKRPGRLEYQRGILARTSNGELVVSRTGAQGSGILHSMVQANCFIVLPTENDGVMAGDQVEVMPFYGIV